MTEYLIKSTPVLAILVKAANDQADEMALTGEDRAAFLLTYFNGALACAIVVKAQQDRDITEAGIDVEEFEADPSLVNGLGQLLALMAGSSVEEMNANIAREASEISRRIEEGGKGAVN